MADGERRELSHVSVARAPVDRRCTNCRRVIPARSKHALRWTLSSCGAESWCPDCAERSKLISKKDIDAAKVKVR